MTDRTPCVVPFCRRTVVAGRFPEWICGVHWPMVDASLKRARRRISARNRRHPTPYRAGLLVRLWERCKRQAVERAAGVTA